MITLLQLVRNCVTTELWAKSGLYIYSLFSESSFKRNRIPLESMQSEENNPNPTPMTAENSSDKIPTMVDRNKKLCVKRRKKERAMLSKLAPDVMARCNQFLHMIRDPDPSKEWKKPLIAYDCTKPVTYLSAWINNDAWQLREAHPRTLPVAVTDASGEANVRKYIVYDDDMPLGEFVDLIRFIIGLNRERPLFVYFKNTEPPMPVPSCLQSMTKIRMRMDFFTLLIMQIYDRRLKINCSFLSRS